MREILFRGKTENGEWMQGYYVKGATRHCIVKSLAGYPKWDVIPSTVGQYTGITDKNGTRIFEGDIVNIEYIETTIKNAVIEYIGASFYGSTFADAWELDEYYQLEVIGNLHDNSELLNN